MTDLMYEQRHILASATERPDLLVHALAQLPDRVELRLPVAASERAPLRTLARAYGIGDRIEFGGWGKSDIPRYTTMAELVEAFRRPEDPPASCFRSGIDLDGQRIALITNIPAPYRIPLFAEMHDRLSADGSLFRVFFLGDRSGRSWMNAAPEGFDHEVLSNVRLPIRQRPPLVPADLGRRLALFRPTIVIAGSLSPLVAGRAGHFARRRGIPFGIWSGEIAAMTTARSRVRRVQRRRLLALADFALTYGFWAGEYLRSLRPDLPLVYARNTSVMAAEPRRRNPSRTVELLAVGDLASPRKGIDVAVNALRLVPELDCRLTVIGGGKLLDDVATVAGGDPRIRFVGAQPPVEVRRHYAEADVLLFPSRADVYGLVVPEAMAAGLTVITSSTPGAVGDLAVAGDNAVVVGGHDPASWSTVIKNVVTDVDQRSRIGDAASRTIATRWTLAHAAEAMIAGIRLAFEGARGERL